MMALYVTENGKLEAPYDISPLLQSNNIPVASLKLWGNIYIYKWKWICRERNREERGKVVGACFSEVQMCNINPFPSSSHSIPIQLFFNLSSFLSWAGCFFPFAHIFLFFSSLDSHSFYSNFSWYYYQPFDLNQQYTQAHTHACTCIYIHTYIDSPHQVHTGRTEHPCTPGCGAHLWPHLGLGGF